MFLIKNIKEKKNDLAKNTLNTTTPLAKLWKTVNLKKRFFYHHFAIPDLDLSPNVP